MSRPPLSDEERAELVAYLDGELTGDAARTLEARLHLDPAVRAEAESLKRTWELLDFLPRPEPSPSFTERTLSRLVPAGKVPGRRVPARRVPWRVAALGAGWAAALLLTAWGSYTGFRALSPREPGEPELVRDLRLIENKRLYELVGDVEFLKQLDDPDLFGEETGG
jgi:anti-sigma factor RsiW